MAGFEAEHGHQQMEGATVPVPADQKILGGLALRGAVTEDELLMLQGRLETAFADLRSDESREAGVCLAYAMNISYGDEERVDQTLLKVAEAENHGMLTRGMLESAHHLWRGADGDKIFWLQKHSGPILMTDDRTPLGIVYSLLGGRPHEED